MGSVILVDDDRTNITLIKRLLEIDGFDVVACPDAGQALAASKNGVDAFIIDCNLAKGDDGIALLKAIRKGDTPASLDCPVIMFSGDDRRSGEARRAGADRFLTKPFSLSTLSDLLRSLMG